MTLQPVVTPSVYFPRVPKRLRTLATGAPQAVMQGRLGMAVGGRPIRGSGPTGAHEAMKTLIGSVVFPFGAFASRPLQVVIQERSMPATWSVRF